MSRIVILPILLGWGILSTGCVYDLSLDGKRCDLNNPCPPGYSCVPDGALSTCIESANDGGSDDGDGFDGGDQEVCEDGATRCSATLDAVETCDGGSWSSTACAGGFYCLDADQIDPACVADCSAHLDCPDGYYCNPSNDHCEPKGDCDNPGVLRCNSALDAVIECNLDSGYDETVVECDPASEYCDPFDPACKAYCDEDLGCALWPETSCEPISRKCLPMNLCTDTGEKACNAADLLTCIEEPGVCMPEPVDEGLQAATSVPADVTCYVGDPAPSPSTPLTCNMQGRVVEFFRLQPGSETVGLNLRIHLQEEVLAGRLDSPLATTIAYDDSGDGQYELTDLPTNTFLVLEVEGRAQAPSPPPFGFSTMYTFGIYLRADDCSSGSISYAAPAMFSVNYPAYANPTGVVEDPDKGLLFGQVRDCTGTKIENAVAGLSMPTEKLYYIAGTGMPDDSATSTLSSGFFAAANVTPIRGMASVLVLSSGTPISLWNREVRVFPGAASLVVFDAPKAPRP